MCNPVAWVMVASLVVTAAAGAYQADAQKKSGQYQQEVAEQNAKLDEFRADQAGQIGSIQEEAARAKVRQIAGTQRANLAAQGIDLGSGTAADMVNETYTMGEADALTVRFNAMNEAWGYRVSAVNERNAGRFARASGNNAATGTYLSTAGSMLSTVSGAYGKGTFSKKPVTTKPGSQMYGGGTGGGA